MELSMKLKEQQNISSPIPIKKAINSLYIKYPGRRISSIESLCKALELSVPELEKIRQESDRYFRLHKVIRKDDGSERYIYDLNQPLKKLHQRLNECFLKRCLYPSYIRGSIKGGDHIASLHCRKAIVIKLDVTNFFPSITIHKVHAIWEHFFGFASEVSEILAGICCYKGALVQGAPVSSYLANLFFWQHEPYVVSQFHNDDFAYGRYVDDVVVSTNSRKTKAEKSAAIQRIKAMMVNEGVVAKGRKTKVMNASKPQVVHNLNVNASKPSMPKPERKNLRAEVDQLNKLVKTLSPEERLKRVRSIKGKLYNMRRTNPNAASKLLKQLPAEK
jgi:hypothetical protein